MFEDIAPRYDVLNHLLSFGMDMWWRRKAVRSLTEKEGGRFLDIGAGTGDFTLAALRTRPHHVVALDFAPQMLNIAYRKIHKTRHKRTSTNKLTIIDFLIADAALLPFKNNSFDAVLVGFGVRNFPNKLVGLNEMHRVLRPSGLVCILELSRPQLPIFAQLFGWYFHRSVPFIGKLLSGHRDAYQYLPESVDSFPEPRAFLSLMREAGFRDTNYQPFTFGIATLFTGRK